MENFDPEEVKKFDEIAEKWWDLKGPFKPLHDINPIRLQFILESLKVKHLKNLAILDVGCGGGILTESLAQLDGNLTGIDASQEAIQVAKTHAKEQKLSIQYVETTAEQFFSSENFDVITCMELLEHVPDPFSVVQSCARLIKPGGYIFFSTLNRNLKSFLFAIVGAEYVLGLIPKGTHEYSKFIRPSELNKMALKADLKIKNMKGMSYSPFTKTYQLSENIDVNYLVCFQKT
jgi:2-polyprenyl-6-hydroxyphenyl methylase / 3-demethylubiquinone-9 3-methyltransferase